MRKLFLDEYPMEVSLIDVRWIGVVAGVTFQCNATPPRSIYRVNPIISSRYHNAPAWHLRLTSRYRTRPVNNTFQQSNSFVMQSSRLISVPDGKDVGA